jgi:DNA polymerase-4
MGRTFLHVDMDAFFAAVEQRDRPELRGRPVVVGAPPDKRGVVAAASYEARRYGIHSAMPSREAGRLCPHAVFLPPDGARYEEVSRQLLRILERFTPWVEPLSIDEAFLDVSGARRLFGTGREIAGRIKGAIRDELGLTASVGVAPNKFLAKLASEMNKPDGLTVVPEDPREIEDFLAPLPVGSLWGVGKVTRGILESAGLRTIGDVQKAKQEQVARLVGGASARHLCALAWGLDDREIEVDGEEKGISREHTFPVDVRDAATIEAVLLDLVDEVGTHLRSAGKYAATVRIKLRWQGFKTLTRQRQARPPACDDFTLRRVAVELFRAIDLVKPVRLIGFGVGNLTRTVEEQMRLFEAGGRTLERRERLSRTVDSLRRKLGPKAIGRAPRRDGG